MRSTRSNDADHVTVDFDYRQVSPHVIPDILTLRKIFGYCEHFVPSDAEKQFFREGRDKILASDEGRETLGILRIGDHGTVGLTGAETYADNGRFRGLVTRMGVGNNDGMRGGRFGVGKQALFLASQVRTVFFSSIDSETGFAGHMGVANLSSFRDPSLGTGDDGKALMADRTVYYCNEEYNIKTQGGSPVIRGQFGLGKRENDDYGTDVFVVGFKAKNAEQLSQDILTVLLTEFIVAIDEGKLEVVLPNGFHLGKDTLEDALNLFRSVDHGKKDSRKVAGLALLLKEKWMDIPDFGPGAVQCKFIKFEGENCCEVTREKGMFVHTFKNVCATADCMGIAAIRDGVLNAAFREMENEAHDSFELSDQRFPDAAKREQAKILFKTLEDALHKYAEAAIGGMIEAKTAAVLPDELEELMDICAGQMAVAGVNDKKKNKKETKLKGAHVKPQKKKQGGMLQSQSAHIDKGEGGEENDDDGNTGTENTNTRKRKKNEGSSGGRKHVNPTSLEENGYALRPLPVPPVFHALGSAASGVYRVKFIVPRSKAKVCLHFSATTESNSQERMHVLSAKAFGPDGAELSCGPDLQGTVVAFENVTAGQTITADVTFDVSYYCYAQVRYYEKKNN